MGNVGTQEQGGHTLEKGNNVRKPTVAQLKEYGDEIGFKDFDAQEFHDHYEANGWMVGRTMMVNWKAAVRNWRRMRRDYGYGRSRKPEPRLPYKERENKINALNRRKAELMRQPESRKRNMELEQIRIQLHKL
jgi:hypothetical protein